MIVGHDFFVTEALTGVQLADTFFDGKTRFDVECKVMLDSRKKHVVKAHVVLCGRFTYLRQEIIRDLKRDSGRCHRKSIRLPQGSRNRLVTEVELGDVVEDDEEEEGDDADEGDLVDDIFDALVDVAAHE